MIDREILKAALRREAIRMWSSFALLVGVLVGLCYLTMVVGLPYLHRHIRG
jgi:hypothetical protein